MALKRAGAARAAAPATAGGSVNFGSDAFYLGGLGLAEGYYAAYFRTQMFQPTKLDGVTPVGQSFLAVMGTFFAMKKNAKGELEFVDAEPSEHPFSCGRKAHESFVPSEDGKGFNAVAGGPSVGMTDMSNFATLRRSLLDCGMPADLIQNDISVLDGIWLHMKNVPESEERKALKSATGAAALQQGGDETQRARFCAVADEILEDGRPWEGGGGLPEGALEAAPAPKKVAAGAKKAAAPTAKATAAVGGTDEDELKAAAIACVTDVLEKNPNGLPKLTLQTSVFEVASKKFDEDGASQIIEAYFTTKEGLTALLGEVGYTLGGLGGGKVLPAA